MSHGCCGPAARSSARSRTGASRPRRSGAGSTTDDADHGEIVAEYFRRGCGLRRARAHATSRRAPETPPLYSVVADDSGRSAVATVRSPPPSSISAGSNAGRTRRGRRSGHYRGPVQRDAAAPPARSTAPTPARLEVEVEGRRLVAVDAAPPGRAANPFTQGFICQKVKHHADRVHGPDRVLTPLLRTGPKGDGAVPPRHVDEALDLIVDRLRVREARPDGPATIVPYLYNSSAGDLGASDSGTVLGASGQRSSPHTICAATTDAAMATRRVGTMPAADPFDVVHADLVVVWGRQPRQSPTPTSRRWSTRAVREQGATVVVVDPRRTAMAKRADLHLAVRPGTDVVLALAVARGSTARRASTASSRPPRLDGVERFLDRRAPWTLDAPPRSAASRPTTSTRSSPCPSPPSRLLRLGWGPRAEPQRRRRPSGPSCRARLLRTVRRARRRILASPASASADPFDAVRRPGRRPPLGRPARRVNQNRLGAMLTDPARSADRRLFVQGANPAAMNPDQATVLSGLARDDLFTVVHDQVLTDTARFADVVLPATTHFEADDVAVLLRLVRRPARAGRHRPGRRESVPTTRCTTAWPAGSGRTRSASPPIPRNAWPPAPARPAAPRRAWCRPRVPPCSSATCSPTGRADGPACTRWPPSVLRTRTYPLVLLSPASHRTINSVFGERVLTSRSWRCTPTTPALAGSPKATGRLRTERRGRSVLPLRVDADVRPGVVDVPKGCGRGRTRPPTAGRSTR